MLEVVICEDNMEYLNSLSHTVEKVLNNNSINGNVVLKTRNPEAVLDFLKQQTSNVFLVDMELGSSMSGYELSKEIRSAVNNKSVIHTQNSKVSCYDSLEYFEKLLCEDNFVRCHKSYIANTNYISEVNLKNKEIIFSTGQVCFIGRKYRKRIDWL